MIILVGSANSTMGILEGVRLDSKRSGAIGGWIGDLLLTTTGLFMLVSSKISTVPGEQPLRVIQFIFIICLVPWYMGYLLHHFDGMKKGIRLFLQWVFGLIILSLVIFLVVNMMPLWGDEMEPVGLDLFIISYGMFFLVLGPMMIIGGYADAKGLDEAHDTSKPIEWPMVTFTMLIIALAIFYMIIIMGYFDPTWSGDASFWVVLLAFFGGPIASIITILPFAYFGKQIEKVDKYRILPQLIAVGVPALTFYSLIWWNDIVLYNMSGLWEGGSPSLSQLLFSLFLSGILPFRIVLLFKPPFKWLQLITGVVALAIYLFGVMSQYGAA